MSSVITAIAYKEKETYVAECPEVSTVDQGETIEQAIANLKKATRQTVSLEEMDQAIAQGASE